MYTYKIYNNISAEGIDCLEVNGFTKEEINLYYVNNRIKFQDTHKSVKYIELKPNILR